MAQKRYFNFKDPDSTFEMARWMNGILEPGLYRGFDYAGTSSMNLLLNHQVTGRVHVNLDLTSTNKNGIAITPYGVIVHDDTELSLPIDPTGDLPRIDLIVMSHQYLQVQGGDYAVYLVIKGTPSATPSAPALVNPNTDIELGRIYLPASTTNLSATGVKYTKVAVPRFSSDITYVKTDVSNQFTKFVGFAQGSDISPDENKILTIPQDGNLFRVVNPSNYEIAFIKGLVPGNEITLLFDSSNTSIVDYNSIGGTIPSGSMFIYTSNEPNIKTNVRRIVKLTCVKSSPNFVRASPFNRLATIDDKNRLENLLSFNLDETVSAGEDLGSTTKIVLSNTSNYFFLKGSEPIDLVAKPITNLEFVDDYVPEPGTEITIKFGKPAIIRDSSNIKLFNVGISNGTNIIFRVETNDSVKFVWNGAWGLISTGAQNLPVPGLTFPSGTGLDSGVLPTIKNLFQNLLTKLGNLITTVSSLPTTTYVNTAISEAQTETEDYADNSSSTAAAAALVSAKSYTDSLVQRHYVADSISSGLVTKTSTSGNIATYTSGSFIYQQQGNVCHLFVDLVFDLSGSWIAGDTINIDLSGIWTDSTTSNPFSLASPLYQAKGNVSVDFDSNDLRDGYLFCKTNLTGTFQIVFKRNVTDPTGSGGKIQFTLLYLTDVI